MLNLNTWVVKLGGALLRTDALNPWLDAIVAAGKRHSVVIVPGGGAFADVVRDLDQRWPMTPQCAHRLAIDAMGLNAQVLADLRPELPVTSRWAELGRNKVGVEIWQPDGAAADQRLPHDWSVTSDSIALALAGYLSARALVLVKSLERIQGSRDSSALSEARVIDSFFPTLLGRVAIPSYILGLSAFAQLDDVFRGGNEMRIR